MLSPIAFPKALQPWTCGLLFYPEFYLVDTKIAPHLHTPAVKDPSKSLRIISHFSRSNGRKKLRYFFCWSFMYGYEREKEVRNALFRSDFPTPLVAFLFVTLKVIAQLQWCKYLIFLFFLVRPMSSSFENRDYSQYDIISLL